MGDMNLTSLLDITFVLLIAFMIVAPTLKHGLEIDLPDSDDSQTISHDNPLTVSVVKREDPNEPAYVYLDGDRVTFQQLTQAIKDRYERKPDLGVVIECDQHEESGVLVQCIEAVQRSGVPAVSISTELE